MTELKRVLMERDELTSDGADQAIADAKARLAEMAGDETFDLDEFLEDEFGLEPDYLFDLL